MKQLLRQLRDRLAGRPRGGSRPQSQDFSLSVPFAPAVLMDESFAIAVVLHLFHEDLAGEFRRAVEHVRAPCDILITTDTEGKKRAITAAFAGWPHGKVEVAIFPNRGRDIAPKLIAFCDRYADYDLLLFLHSKKSESADFGTAWRNHLVNSLCGSPAIVASVLALFAADRGLGMVAPQTFGQIRDRTGWRGLGVEARSLSSRLGLDLDLNGTLDFPAGSMFWARPNALGPLLELKLTPEDFPEEMGQFGGTIAHVIERLFLLICERAGYHWVKVEASHSLRPSGPVIAVGSPRELGPAIEQAKFCVSQTMLRKPAS